MVGFYKVETEYYAYCSVSRQKPSITPIAQFQGRNRVLRLLLGFKAETEIVPLMLGFKAETEYYAYCSVSRQKPSNITPNARFQGRNRAILRLMLSFKGEKVVEFPNCMIIKYLLFLFNV